jgi:hypothetical protein
MQRKTWKRLSVIGCLLGASACSAWHHPRPSDDLFYAAQRVKGGEVVVVPLGFDGKGAVALQFDLVFDPTLVEISTTTTSAATTGAGKQLSVRPVARGIARVVVYGANLDPLPSASLGSLRFRALRDASVALFRAQEVAAPDAAGRELAIAVRPGRIASLGGGLP